MTIEEVKEGDMVSVEEAASEGIILVDSEETEKTEMKETTEMTSNSQMKKKREA